MKKNKIILILLMMLATASCQKLKDAVSGAKQENSDEFLVEKKNPLELPPDFDQLPVPNKNKKNIQDRSIVFFPSRVTGILIN